MSEQSLVQNQAEAIIQIRTMMERYESDVIIEAFLPGDDITMGYVQGPDDECTLLTTWYLVLDKPGATSILGQNERFMSWGEGKKMVEVEEEGILTQVEALIPKVCKILNIRDITRIDGRLDGKGQLKIFDVNGFPALSFPKSVGVKQALTYVPDYVPIFVFDALVNTILLSAANRYHKTAPECILSNNLFVLRNAQKVNRSS